MPAGCKIESIGVHLPHRMVSTSEIAGRLRMKKPPKLELLTGISFRRVCDRNEDSLTLALDAARDCFLYSEYKPGEIEMVICCSISRYINGLNHYYDPPVSTMIKQRLGCPNALSFDIHNACAGMITGIHVANNFIAGGVVKNCLVVSGEYITSISNNAERNIDSSKHPEMASLTVGDAGAAVILTETLRPEERFTVSEIATLSRYSDLCTGFQCPDHPGGTMKTQMKKIHEVSILNAPYYIENALKKAGLNMNQIDYIIPHQTAKQSIESGAKHYARFFGELPGKIIINLKETGNTASTTHFTTLYKSLKENLFKAEDKIMLLSFASGLNIGIIIFTVSDLVRKYGYSC